MPARLDLSELLLSSAGRIGRRAYALAVAIQLAAALLLRPLTPASWPWWAGLPLYALVLFSAGCVTSKRLHDRGRSGWWGLILIPLVMLLWSSGGEMLGDAGWRHWFGLVAVLIVGSSGVQLLLLRGEPRFNRWGAVTGEIPLDPG